MTNDEKIRLILELTGTSTIEEATRAVGKLDDSLKDAKESSVNMGRATLDAGRALQDFAQGGIGGILNNIEGLTRSLGGGPGLAGILTAVGLAAYFAIPAIKSMWEAVTDGSNQIPKSTDSLKALNDEIGQHKKRLDELEKQGKLTNSQLAEYNQLTAEQTRLEKEANAERERRNTLDRARKGAPGQMQEEMAANVQASINGREAVDSAIGQAKVGLMNQSSKSGRLGQLRSRLSWLTREANKQSRNDPFDLTGSGHSLRKQIAEVEGQIKAEEGAIGEQAAGLVSGALTGDEKSVRDLAGMTSGPIRDRLKASLPEAIAAGNDEVQQAIDDGEKAHQAAARRRERAKQDRMVDRVAQDIDEDVARSNERDENERLRKTREQNAYEERLKAEQERDSRRAADKARHDADPSEQLQRQSAQRLDAASAEAMRQNQQGGYGFTPEQLQQAARMAASMPGDIGPNVDQTFGAIMQAMMRQQQQNQALGQQFNQWGQRFQSLPMMSEPWGGAGF